MTAGPLIGGALAAAGGPPAAMPVNAGTFLCVALAGRLLGTRREPEAEPGDERPRARDRIVHLFRDRTLGTVLAVVFVSLLFMSASITAEVFFVKDDLGAGDALYGVVFSCWMVGMVFGALAVSRRIPPAAMAAVALAAVAVQGAGLGLPTGSSSPSRAPCGSSAGSATA